MRNGRLFAASVLILGALGADARGLGSVADALEHMPDYAATVTYAVTLPQAEDDVIYTVDLQQPGSDDHYLINWSVETPSGPQSGFTAWFDGNFYNFRNRRLQEIHGKWDPSAPENGRAAQNTVQFASLLPRRMAAELRALTPDRYDVSVKEDPEEIRVYATRRAGDIADAELCWRFDAATMEPLEFSADYNPGAISGQQVKAVYNPAANPLFQPGEKLSEEGLRDLYPQAFGQYRESNFAVEQLRGEPLPSFSLPLIGGSERLSRAEGQQFKVPTAVVIFDPTAALSPQLVSAVRAAIDRLPADADVIWACAHKNPDVAAELLGTLRTGESAVTGAASLATDCGAANLPVVLACDTRGRVSDLVIGLNNQLDVDVIRMFSTMTK